MKKLYIPIWLYSNKESRSPLIYSSTSFTFQSGYIQIPTLPSIISHLYTLHSNLVIFKYTSYVSIFFVDCTLHSNLVIFKYYQNTRQRSAEDIFTFQSGYIQMDYKDVINILLDTLHSNLVIFKSRNALVAASAIFTLHSNLVIFKLLLPY